MNILLDTSVIIDYLRAKDKAQTWLYQLSRQEAIFAISIITHSELWAGKSVWESKNRSKQLTELFKAIKILELDLDVSKQAGQLHAKKAIHLFDAMIAATAIKYDYKLATLNQKDFQKIEKLKLLPQV